RLRAFDGRDRLSHVLASPKFHLLGTSATVTTLAGVHLDLERYDRRRVDGLWMDRDSVDRMVDKLAGCAILEAIRAVWPSERLRVADRGLREGILSELMADDGVWRNNGRGRA
ncbi:MAG: Ppx/GppA family phosphatase, partial [Mesorhizobium sp.]